MQRDRCSSGFPGPGIRRYHETSARPKQARPLPSVGGQGFSPDTTTRAQRPPRWKGRASVLPTTTVARSANRCAASLAASVQPFHSSGSAVPESRTPLRDFIPALSSSGPLNLSLARTEEWAGRSCPDRSRACPPKKRRARALFLGSETRRTAFGSRSWLRSGR